MAGRQVGFPSCSDSNSGAIVPAERHERKRGKKEGGLVRAFFLYFLTRFFFFLFSRRCTVAPLYYLNVWNKLGDGKGKMKMKSCKEEKLPLLNAAL